MDILLMISGCINGGLLVLVIVLILFIKVQKAMYYELMEAMETRMTAEEIIDTMNRVTEAKNGQ